MSKQRGQRKIVAINVREEARHKALELGADEVYDPGELPSEYFLGEWGQFDTVNGMGLVVEAFGTQPGLILAGRMARARGAVLS